MPGLDEIEELRTPLLEERDFVAASVQDTLSNGSPIREREHCWFELKTLLPDSDWEINGTVILNGGIPAKLTKLIAFTFLAIFWLNWLVSHRENHRDDDLSIGKIWKFEGGLIVRDVVVFFLVGRMWKMRGVDNFAWAGIVLGCNAVLEAQHYVSWLRHSSTLWDIHCTWEWQTWAYAVICCAASIAVAAMHIIQACKERNIVMKTFEISLSIVFFLVPVIPSPYFHFHHWFAGWLFGMHANFDRWWSRAAMAWCYGLYINGVAVYGRDPVLTCGYAYFLSWDQKCPYLECGHVPLPSHGLLGLDQPANWRNCSDDRYHP